jgi:site-specific recombinase XerD
VKSTLETDNTSSLHPEDTEDHHSMSRDLVPVSPKSLAADRTIAVPALILDAGEQAAWHFLDFFTARIPNDNTRAAYKHAVYCFFAWCHRKRLKLAGIRPSFVATYLKELGKDVSVPTVKQHLAAIRMLFDWLVIGQLLPFNPASSVRAPKYVIKQGKTPVLTAEEARLLLDTILPARSTVLAVDAERRTVTVRLEETGKEKVIEVRDEMRLLTEDRRKTFRLIELVTDDKLSVVQREGEIVALCRGWGHHSLTDLRDRALIAVMLYSFARVSAAIGMNVEDYFQKGKRGWFRLHEKGGKYHEVPAHHNAERYVDNYLEAAGIDDRKGPLFRSFNRKLQLTDRRMHRIEVLLMIKRRARQAGLPEEISCHTFRATGITNYLQNGGTIEKAQQIAAHESPRTTKLYDRTNDQLTLDEIEKIQI